MTVTRTGVILIDAAGPEGPGETGGLVSALQPVANQPIVCHVLDALTAGRVDEVVVLAPSEISDRVRSSIADARPGAAPPRFVITGDRAPAQLRAAAEVAGDASCIVHRGDGLLAQPLAPFLRLLDHGRTDLMLLAHRGVSRSPRPRRCARPALRAVTAVPDRVPLQVAGVGLFGPGALRKLSTGRVGDAPALDFAALGDLVSRHGGRLDVQLVRAWRQYAGDAHDLLELNRATLDGLASDYDAVHENSNEIEGRVVIHPTASVTSSVIVGPAIIGARARVCDAYVGPYTSIGARARVEGAEVERSIIFPGAAIAHLGGRLVSSVVGTNARVYRDFSLPRAIRLRCGPDAEIVLC